MRIGFLFLLIALAISSPPTASAENQRVIFKRDADDPVNRLARTRTDAMSKLLLELRTLPAEKRITAGQELGLRLERLVNQVQGTRYENQAVYWLAQWSLEYRTPEDAINQLKKLETLPYEGLKSAGQLIYIHALLKLGNVAAARKLCEQFMDAIPEAEATMRLIMFHELAGTLAPPLKGHNLTGGPSDPLRSRSETWQYCLFFDPADPAQLFHVRQQLSELSTEEYNGRLGITLVALSGDPLSLLELSHGFPGTSSVDLLWMSPHDGSVDVLNADWQLPNPPASALLGPVRNIMAINPPSERLHRSILNKKPAKKKSSAVKSPKRGGLSWKGRKK